MNFKLVSDSSSNVFDMPGVPFQSVPLKIIFGDREYVDQPGIDTAKMVAELEMHKGGSGTSCPNVQEWYDAFGDADCVFGVAITSNLSGSWAAGAQAVRDYEENNPGKRAFILDSLSAGPALALMLEDALAAVEAGGDFEAVKTAMIESQKHNKLIFCLQSLNNLARNGRVSPAVAKIAGILGIRMVGRASDEGTLEPLHKPRGEAKALEVMLRQMEQDGYKGGRVRITHGLNPAGAEAFRALIAAKYPQADITVGENTGLCTFYAEKGGIMVGFSDL